MRGRPHSAGGKSVRQCEAPVDSESGLFPGPAPSEQVLQRWGWQRGERGSAGATALTAAAIRRIGGLPDAGLAAPDSVDHGEDKNEEEESQHGPEPCRPRLPLDCCVWEQSGVSSLAPGWGPPANPLPPGPYRAGPEPAPGPELPEGRVGRGLARVCPSWSPVFPQSSRSA